MLSLDHPAYALLPGFQANSTRGISDRWNQDAVLATPVQLTYSFMTRRPTYYTDAARFAGFQAFTSAQRTAARAALGLWSEVARITFTEVADEANNGAGGQIRLGQGTLNNGSSAGRAFLPGTLQEAGDVEINTRIDSNTELDPGDPGFATMLHEIGHALGLEHPGNYGGGAFAPHLTDYGVTDNTLNTIMSYTDAPRNGQAWYTSSGNSYRYGYDTGLVDTRTPMLYDIAAIQVLYGANQNTRAGNTIYRYEVNPRLYVTIWDGGGQDTLDASNQTRSNIINLNAGSRSSIGYLEDPLADMPANIASSFRNSFPSVSAELYNGSANIAIAFGVTIERAVGGSNNDTLIGNSANNLLTGGPGQDTLTGNAGQDTFRFTDPSDGQDRITDFANGDRLLFRSRNFGNLPAGPLASSLFVANSTGTATNDNQRFVFNTTSRLLAYDADGNGAGAAVAMVTLNTGLTASAIQMAS